MCSIKENIERIKEHTAEAAVKSGRNLSDVKLMAATKTVDCGRIVEAINAGIKIIGENYIQEAQSKIEKIGNVAEWHMIGHLQSNKAKYAVKLFNMIHSIDRMNLANELDSRSKAAGCITNILIEVNAGKEKTKSGVPIDEVIPLILKISKLENLSVQGLMTMPPWFNDPDNVRPYFSALRELKEKILNEDIPNVYIKELSMGMSNDYIVAVEEGATIVRLGRAIFGERT